ncbi:MULTISPECIES: AMP-binding protein [unclassified Sphingopyxis]|jgi:fatty-acyl-CoA synthase|uniref:AMP-binding protein n=1 Tax=unclassified Sphingopyxis TaxID=2614943 RepID=UPI0006C14B76|nr:MULTISPECIES: AMP-binding protein [unclassified Sphingopyxis]USI75826.1 AMP-binding protein [Sphingopyxis sp. USTB-05]GAO77636.1 acetoacetyl-CoA synthetase [Sphingopyxis sp. C-1]
MTSHVTGASEPPLIEHTIGEALALAAERWGSSDALVSVGQGIRWTFAELLERSDAFAAGLLALGLNPGDRIGIWAPNCAEWTLTQFAAARAGLILVTINPAYRLSEVEYTINKVGLSALVAATSFKTSDYPGMIEELAPEAVTSTPGQLRAERLPTLRSLILIGPEARPGWLPFDDAATLATDTDRQRLAAIGPALDPNDAINIQFTSGTTGLPKGATLSHRNILNNGYFVGRTQGLGEGDRICIPVPLYHCFGMVMGNLASITHGAAMIYPSEGFDPEAVLRAVEAERCTALYGVPTMFIAVLAHPRFDDFDVSSLRTGCMAGAICPEPLMRQVVERLNMRDVTIAYGMTETSPVSFQTAPDDPFERRVGSIGRVQPHLECKIVDGGGNIVPSGEAGELCTRGYSVMIGYWDEAERTADSIDADGWMHSGDLATIDAEGYGNIVGRLKDMVIRGGENIYPREIEDYLYRHPFVEDVAVVGIPDERMGEELCAWVRLKPDANVDAEAIREFCRGQIAHYKVPRYVRIVGEFPTTVTGKVQKYLIREAMVADLQKEEVE